jgi:hypothetical protein
LADQQIPVKRTGLAEIAVLRSTACYVRFVDTGWSPYAPGAGQSPCEFAGRDGEVLAVDVAMERVVAVRHEVPDMDTAPIASAASRARQPRGGRRLAGPTCCAAARPTSEATTRRLSRRSARALHFSYGALVASRVDACETRTSTEADPAGSAS